MGNNPSKWRAKIAVQAISGQETRKVILVSFPEMGQSSASPGKKKLLASFSQGNGTSTMCRDTCVALCNFLHSHWPTTDQRPVLVFLFGNERSLQLFAPPQKCSQKRPLLRNDTLNIEVKSCFSRWFRLWQVHRSHQNIVVLINLAFSGDKASHLCHTSCLTLIGRDATIFINKIHDGVARSAK